jgi:hypothetical protein
LTDLALRIIKVPPEACAPQTEFHAGRLDIACQSVRAIGTLLNFIGFMFRCVPFPQGEINGILRLRLVEEADVVGAGIYTELAANTLLIILGYDTIITPADCICGTDRQAGRHAAMLTGDGNPSECQIIGIGTSGSVLILTTVGINSVIPFVVR